MGNNIRSSSRPKALAPSVPMPPLADAMDAVHLSVDRFCLLAGVDALAEMMEEDATTVCGARHRRHGDRRGYRWGRTHSEIGYHGGKVKVARPRVRDRAGKEVSLESWQALRDGNLLLEWALNLMVLNVSTRKYHRAVRLPEGDLAKARGGGTSKSAVSRRFVALSRKKMKAWLASDLSELDLLVIQIDGLHVGDHVLMAAMGVDGNGDKHVLAVVEGATENTVVVQALIDNLLARGLDPTLPRLFIVDGAKALSKAIRNTFGVAAAIQRCQVHKGRNIIERLPQHLHASVKKALRQAWDQDDANKAERLLRNLVRRLEHEEPGVSGSILEGLDEILTALIQAPELFEALADWKPVLSIQPSGLFDSGAGARRLRDVFGVATLDGLGTFGRAELGAAGAVVAYAQDTQKGALPRLRTLSQIDPASFMAIDAATRRNLELARTLSGERAGSLLAFIDRTLTGAGARLLASRLSGPHSRMPQP